ncbi:hypothetical protein PFNF54_04861 [Plasmodium falciparum NF54]|uniref:Dynein regulatory complex protein 1 C-terminal domain-containing protein n=1 Tax=Plasmodium falciparum (isolate NF54) TaxID=5843 RepID=W7JZI4_PLAFO|nr:hypothetical protein PFNF54_04861 [Plasmodium falciparum NF54]
MDILLCTSKEGRIEKRRNKILNKIKEDNNGTEKKLSEIKNNFEENDKENEDNQYSLVNNFEYTNNEHTENYANIKNDIISRLSEKKNDYLHELSNKRNNEEKHFLQNIKKYSTDTLTKNNALNFDQYIDYKNDFPEHTYVSSFQYNMMDVTNLALKEKETYKKKVDKYFSLLKYKDEQIKKVCEINSKNVTTFISFVRNQMEGYKIYLEDEEEKIRKILNYIGVHTKEDLELLTELFYIDADEENYLINKFNKNEDENNIPYNSEYTLDIILKYYQEKEKENTCRISKDKQKYKNRLNISLKIILDRKKQEKEYWYNLSNLTPDHMITLWKTFSIYVEKYYHILKERASIIQNIFDEEKLMKQNINKINRMKKELS